MSSDPTNGGTMDYGARDELHALAQRIIILRPKETSTKWSDTLVDQLQLLARNRVFWAREALGRFSREGARRYMTQTKKGMDTGGLTVTHQGAVIKRLPHATRSQAFAVRDDTGKSTGEYQQKVWDDYNVSWDEFVIMAEAYGQRLERQQIEYARLKFILALRDVYPQSTSPGEALRLAGIDPADMTVAI